MLRRKHQYETTSRIWSVVRVEIFADGKIFSVNVKHIILYIYSYILSTHLNLSLFLLIAQCRARASSTTGRSTRRCSKFIHGLIVEIGQCQTGPTTGTHGLHII